MTIEIKKIDELLSRRKYEDALSVCMSFSGPDDGNVDLLERKAEAYKGLGDDLSAFACLDSILSIDPFCAAAYFKKSVWMFGAGRHEESIDLLNKAIELDSGYFREISFFIISENFFRLRKYNEAIDALSHVSPDFEIRYMLGYKIRTASDLKRDLDSAV